jgi:hypothetical protein
MDREYPLPSSGTDSGGIQEDCAALDRPTEHDLAGALFPRDYVEDALNRLRPGAYNGRPRHREL